MGEKIHMYRFSSGNLKETSLGRPKQDGQMILKWILRDRLSWCALDASG
jgi:hypothetical protein